ncbi:MAG: ATP-binding cassette domain-containing protein [Niabella sp.]
MKTLQIKHLVKRYGNHEVLNIPDLELRQGNYWIKGPNGSGKSTFLKVLAGLIPFKGNIILNEQIAIHNAPVAYRMAISHAPAEPAYPSFLSGQELVGFYLKVKNGTPGQVNEIKSALGIDHYLDNPCGSYSSGMLKKLSLLLAFTGNSEWILLDEPFTTLDTAAQNALQHLIHSTKNKGFIFTSHHDISPADISLSGVYHVQNKNIIIEPGK